MTEAMLSRYEKQYELILQEHRTVVELRAKILTGWFALYIALAAAFAWVYENATGLSWAVMLLGLVITILFWILDIRNRSGLRIARDAGEAIEAAAEVPYEQRFFYQLAGTQPTSPKLIRKFQCCVIGWIERKVSHGLAIDLMVVVVGLCFFAALLFFSLVGGAAIVSFAWFTFRCLFS